MMELCLQRAQRKGGGQCGAGPSRPVGITGTGVIRRDYDPTVGASCPLENLLDGATKTEKMYKVTAGWNQP